MFPYPSGALHMGHLRVYTISDILARFERMRGKRVIHPMGWDAFGLPAENAAIEGGVSAKEWTEKNIDSMKEQFSLMNVGFDWDREIRTCSPDYYVHTQRLFLKLYEHGLAYRKESLVNWDPVDKTVLANEQVSPNGTSWRSGAVVEQRTLPQWFFKITDYKDALLEGLGVLRSRWPDKVRTMQENWIGLSKGVKVKFPLTIGETDLGSYTYLEAYTTRLDTLFGVQFLAISSIHPLALKASETDGYLCKFLLASGTRWAKNSKKGELIRGFKALHPLTNEEIPIYVANYVVDGTGTSVLMGVPGHDSRDNGFWATRGPKDVPAKIVVDRGPADGKGGSGSEDGVFKGLGILNGNCGRFAGMSSADAQERLLEELKMKNLGEAYTNTRLNDWLVSRQRCWGTPIPIVHCESCGIVPVKEGDLPVVLPDIEKLSPKGGNPLASVKEWIETSCPRCGGEARRETDTMDTFVDSSWYFMRYVDPHNKESPFSPEMANELLPVDVYIGGNEHAILHLLYARFISKFLNKIGMWPSGGNRGNQGEPFKRLVTQGMVSADGASPLVSWEKMSKSKFNGTDPRECISRWGADATRAHLLFSGPVGAELRWDESKIIGMHRWFNKLWRHTSMLSEKLAEPDFLILPSTIARPITTATIPPEDHNLVSLLQESIRNNSSTLSKALTLNTVVSNLIKLTNAITSPPPEAQPTLATTYRATNELLRMLAPIAPGFSEECWAHLHTHVPSMSGTRVLETAWPWHFLQGERLGGMTTCFVNIDGRFRFKMEADRERLMRKFGEGEQYMRDLIAGEEEARKWLNGKEIKRVFVSSNGKTVNLMTRWVSRASPDPPTDSCEELS
ncbi:leucyl-tRNA synthetase [Tuber magnatum]|uniref:leucine--tRNA ligase n=1 Tax=Tuber magnatum TaxID=42249 RepID=A0A317T1J4_9PEZI|nr:leucyl-tRNA synthetase [Tuber magnatum]